MPQTAGDIVRFVMSRLPGLQELEAMTLYSSALRWLYNKHEWLFLLRNDIVTTEAPYSANTLTATTGSAALVGDSTLWDPTWVSRKIVIQGIATPFDVVVTGATTATLQANGANVNWPGATNSGLSYRIYRDVYTLAANFDWGRSFFWWDPSQTFELPMIDVTLMLREKAIIPGNLGQPMAVCRAPLQQATPTTVPAAAVEFGPYVPDAVRSYNLWGFPIPAITTADNQYPLWPVGSEDLIGKRMQIEYGDNPRHRMAPSANFMNEYLMAVWDLFKRNDGGAEIQRIRQRYNGGGMRRPYLYPNGRVLPDVSGWPNSG